MIDINCDMGEGLDNEHVLMPLISSCNIACGAHAGSVAIMDRVLELAQKNQVKIGAHPGFADKANFGRKVLNISNEELQNSIEEQLHLFVQRAALQRAAVHHVKPHGALYNLIAVNEEKAAVVVKAIQQVFGKIKIYVPYNSVIEEVARANGLEIVYEAFADRNYNDNLTLVSRSEVNAILTEPKAIAAHVRRMATKGKVITLTGAEKEIKAHTFCIHGDNENVLKILQELNAELR